MRFSPGGTGPRTAVLHIASNDSDENPFDITLSGVGLTALQNWRQTHFGNPDNSGDGADLNDYENDGIVNVMEAAFGLDPKQSSAGQLPQPHVIGDDLVINFPEPAGMSGITYGAEWSTTLLPGSWTAVADTGTPPQHTFSVPIGNNLKGFMRLVVTGEQE